MPQKFHHGDRVKIINTTQHYKNFFKKDKEAIVLYSYGDVYGKSIDNPDKKNTYSLYVKGEGSSSWYIEDQLELISSQQIALLDQWKKQEE